MFLLDTLFHYIISSLSLSFLHLSYSYNSRLVAFIASTLYVHLQLSSDVVGLLSCFQDRNGDRKRRKVRHTKKIDHRYGGTMNLNCTRRVFVHLYQDLWRQSSVGMNHYRSFKRDPLNRVEERLLPPLSTRMTEYHHHESPRDQHHLP